MGEVNLVIFAPIAFVSFYSLLRKTHELEATVKYVDITELSCMERFIDPTYFAPLDRDSNLISKVRAIELVENHLRSNGVSSMMRKSVPSTNSLQILSLSFLNLLVKMI